jgi:integrase
MILAELAGRVTERLQQFRDGGVFRAEADIGWVFRRITRSDAVGRNPLSAESLRLILKERAWEAGYRGPALARITPHSLRAGCITTLAQASVHERDIMRHSRHDSQTVMRTYIRVAATQEVFTFGALWRRKDA